MSKRHHSYRQEETNLEIPKIMYDKKNKPFNRYILRKNWTAASDFYFNVQNELDYNLSCKFSFFPHFRMKPVSN